MSGFSKNKHFFTKKMISFSSSGHLMENSTFFLKFHFFFFFLHKIDIFGRKLILRETLVTLTPFACTTWFYHVLKNSLICPKTNAFLHKLTFFSKRKQRHQKLTLFKNKRYSFKKTKYKTKYKLENNIFENDDNLAKKIEALL